MKRLFIFLTIILLQAEVLIPSQLHAQPTQLGEGAFASLLTIGPGEPPDESFGHSAIRICDSANDFDMTFNYGSYYFDQEHFYLKFLQGSLKYFVEPQSFENFILEYGYYGRSVWEQQLLLDSVELVTLYRALIINTKPENKFFTYDFFRDNCATRVRDIIEQSLHGRKLISNTFPAEPNSYRTLIHKYTDSTLLWWRLGFDLLLGLRCDETLTKPQYMYIPMEMMTQYDTTLLASGQTLTGPEVQLLTDKRIPLSKSLSPTLCFWVLFAFVALLTLASRWKKWRLYWLDALLFTVASLVGLVMLYLWFFSDHYCCEWNLNVMWANPLMLWIVCRLRHPNYIVALIVAAIQLVFLVGYSFWPQQFNPAVIPITLTLVLRLASRLYRTDWKK